MNLAEIKTKSAALNLKLLEASVDFYTYLGLLDPRDLGNYDPFNAFGGFAPPVRRMNQGRGEVLPVYLTWQQLRDIRDRSRVLAAENQFAISALLSLQNFVVGKGFTYRATASRKQGVSPRLVEMTQQVIDAFTDYHELNQIEREALWRLHRDGEFFLRFFPGDDGLVRMRFVEPEWVISPGDTYGAEYTFGVQTLPHDVQTVLGYWIVENPLAGWVPSFVEASEVLHVKANVDSSAKRGLPTFYSVEDNLRRVDDLLASMTSLAKSRAKIAMIRRFNGTVKDTVNSFVNNLTEITATDPTTNTTQNIERLRYGTILNASGNIDYEFPGAEVGASDYVEVIQAELRAVAARVGIPEYMLSAKSDDVNYSSALVNESPAHKNFETQQRFMARRFGECRYEGRESVVWKQLRHAVDLGILPPNIYRDVDVQVEPPNLNTRDPDKQAATDKVYVEMGVKSVATVQQELGLDSDQERASIAKERAERQAMQPMQAQQQPGQPQQGEPGKEQVRESVEDAQHHLHADDGKFTGNGGGGSGGGEKLKPHERAKAKLDALRQKLADHLKAEPPEYDPPDEPTPPKEPDDEPQPGDYDDPAEFEADRQAWEVEDAAYRLALGEFKAAHAAWEKEVERGEEKYARDFDRWEARKERLADRLDEKEQEYEERYGPLHGTDEEKRP